jgi:hypothetical protein
MLKARVRVRVRVSRDLGMFDELELRDKPRPAQLVAERSQRSEGRSVE